MRETSKAYFCERCIHKELVNYRKCPECGHDDGGSGWIRNYNGLGEHIYVVVDEKDRENMLALRCKTCGKSYLPDIYGHILPSCECNPIIPEEVRI